MVHEFFQIFFKVQTYEINEKEEHRQVTRIKVLISIIFFENLIAEFENNQMSHKNSEFVVLRRWEVLKMLLDHFINVTSLV